MKHKQSTMMMDTDHRTFLDTTVLTYHPTDTHTHTHTFSVTPLFVKASNTPAFLESEKPDLGKSPD